MTTFIVVQPLLGRGDWLRAGDRRDSTPSREQQRCSQKHYVGEFGRLRDAVVAPDDSLWILTNNTGGRGEPGPDDDRVLRINLA